MPAPDVAFCNAYARLVHAQTSLRFSAMQAAAVELKQFPQTCLGLSDFEEKLMEFKHVKDHTCDGQLRRVAARRNLTTAWRCLCCAKLELRVSHMHRCSKCEWSLCEACMQNVQCLQSVLVCPPTQ